MAQPTQSWQYGHSCVVERSWKTLLMLFGNCSGSVLFTLYCIFIECNYHWRHECRMRLPYQERTSKFQTLTRPSLLVPIRRWYRFNRSCQCVSLRQVSNFCIRGSVRNYDCNQNWPQAAAIQFKNVQRLRMKLHADIKNHKM